LISKQKALEFRRITTLFDSVRDGDDKSHDYLSKTMNLVRILYPLELIWHVDRIYAHAESKIARWFLSCLSVPLLNTRPMFCEGTGHQIVDSTEDLMAQCFRWKVAFSQ
jgi:hypothetical protein